jgi:signal transduction histidine kinase
MRRPSGRRIDSRASTYPRHVRGVWTWLCSHPREADLALAAIVVLATVGQSAGDKLILVVAAILAATLLARRAYPVEAFAVAAVIAVIQIFLGLAPGGGYNAGAWQPSAADITIAILLFTVAAHTSRRTSLIGLAVCLLLSVLAVFRWGPAHQLRSAVSASGAHMVSSGGLALAAAALLCSISLTAWVLGDTVAYRHRVALTASLEERAARLEAERDAQARIAAAAERARELQERRAHAVEDAAARLRRIERDLHDGAQVRLAALALALGEIKENLDAAAGGAESEGEDQTRTRMLIGNAHRNAKETLAELRDLARGIHPAVLDRGLDAALAVLAESSAVPVTLTVSITQRPSPAIETIAYFCAAELLANITKHANASRAEIAVADKDGELVMTVTDNGAGGAHVVAVGGLAGLRERVQTVDGGLVVISPDGGPTTVRVVLPVHA